jgi:tetratricopeptide (TPR) repeat protein
MRRWSWLFCSAFAVATFAGVATADNTPQVQPYAPCTTKPSDEDQKAAKGAFAAGNGSFNEADYKTAITYWRDAYRRDCTAHALLLNLARAYELDGNKAEAVNALKTFLERKPDAANKPQILKRIENLEAKEGPVPAVTGPSTAGTVPPPGTTGPTAPVSSGPAGTAEPPSSATPSTKQNIWPFVAMGGGGLITIIGGLAYLGGKSKYDDVVSQCDPSSRTCPKSLVDQINADKASPEKQMTTGAVLFFGGAAIAAGGAVWYFVYEKPRQNAAAHPARARLTEVTPVVGSSFTGFSLAGTF